MPVKLDNEYRNIIRKWPTAHEFLPLGDTWNCLTRFVNSNSSTAKLFLGCRVVRIGNVECVIDAERTKAVSDSAEDG